MKSADKTYCTITVSTIWAVLLLLSGCTHTPLEERGRQQPYADLRQAAVAASEEFARHQDESRPVMEHLVPPMAEPEPILPRYDPLDDILVSISMDNEDVRHVLAALAKETGMNLSLHPDLASEARIVSLQFEEVPASRAFKEILRIADVHGEVDGNILRISLYQEKIYTLDFIETNIQATFDVGGDVLGTGGGQDDQSLTGNFKLSGTGGTVSNPYDILDTMLRPIIANQGIISLNRLGGTLFVRSRPSVIYTVDQLLSRYRTMLRRQILLEARIIEVALADNYSWGIDWSLLRTIMEGNTVAVISKAITQGISTAGAINRTSTPGTTAPEVGMVISRTHGDNSSLMALSMLENFGDVHVLSNPTIRARHGQPALISVGESNTYIRESTTTTSTGTGSDTVSTDIETDTVFDGLLLGIIPFIGDHGRISLSIHPIKSDVDEESLSLVQVGDTAVSLPRVNLKELSTSIRLNDGDTVVLGGLIDKTRTQGREGLPGVTRTPGIGSLFTDENMHQEVRELVIILRVSQL